MINNLQFYRFRGHEAISHFNEMATLRIEIFKDYPYLYQGTMEYETTYIHRYFKTNNSFVLIVKDADMVVGMTTCILANEEEPILNQVFEKFNYNTKEILYLGESLLLPSYRGQGLGKLFFEEREKFGQSCGINKFAFCSVIRQEDHPLKPKNYRNLSTFWLSQGYQPQAGMTTELSWIDINQTVETQKTMQYWMKFS